MKGRFLNSSAAADDQNPCWDVCDYLRGGVDNSATLPIRYAIGTGCQKYFLAKSKSPKSLNLKGYGTGIYLHGSHQSAGCWNYLLLKFLFGVDECFACDVGSSSYWVAVGQSEQDVREFGVFNQDLIAMADWLKEKNVKTIAMESTGTYWQNLYAVLLSKGFHLILCNGKFTKNIKGKKTDVLDCQWIQKLHTLG